MRCISTRRGLLRNPWHAFLLSIALVAVLILVLAWDPKRWFGSSKREATLHVYCAAGLRIPMEEAAERYEELYGVQVQIDFGASGQQLATAVQRKSGDLYIAADYIYLKKARERGAVEEELPVAYMRPMLAVRRGNPKKIRSLTDALDRKDIKLAMADPDAAAIGTLVRENLKKSIWKRLEARATTVLPTVTEVSGAVALGVDAGIVWDAVIAQSKDLEMLPIPELRESDSDGAAGLLGGGTGLVLKRESKDVRGLVAIGVLRYSQQPDEALRFARFLSARDEGLGIFSKHSYDPIPDGDLWAEGEPKIVAYLGAMLEPAVDATLDDFAKREGIPRGNITTVYNGCGILVSQMKAGQRPDIYFSCDQRFMDDDEVKPLFIDETVVSTNQLVILVKKGRNDLRTIRDLRQPGIRVGVGDEHKCAMGLLTSETLRRTGMENEVRKNVVVESPSGGELVSQMIAGDGSLDAVVAYVSNARAVSDRLDAYPIDIDCAIATQPVAVYRFSNHKYFCRRLIRALTSEQSRERFEEWGFGWKAGKK